MKDCGFPTLARPCPQETYNRQRWCPYHEKIANGLLVTTDRFLSESEIRATMGGRRHQDGRRLDAYVIE